ncbi:MAG: NYN domain-containing protein [Rubrivivax sp.]|nr:NYN domain-containing protein [Rubrivivax sp.]
MTSPPRVMLLIDADNVSTDVVEQAVSRLHAEYGALHVRRAYGTAEAAVKHQKLFKRLSIRPMVNLAAGKNSTDIALAVDALDLVIAERPDVVVIASSDSDFAPLVSRIREKGCLVRGVGQKGKVGEETPLVYDEFIEFEHRPPRSRAAAAAAPRPVRARKSATAAALPPDSTAAGRAEAGAGERAAADGPAVAAAAPGAPRKTAARKSAAARRADDAPAAGAAAAKTARKSAAAKAATGRTAAAKDVAGKAKAARTTATKAAATRAAAGKTAAKEPDAAALPAAPLGAPPDKVARALDALPQLAAGQRLDVQAAAAVLRKERVFSNADSWPKFFERYKDWFELTPPERPTHVQRRPAG